MFVEHKDRVLNENSSKNIHMMKRDAFRNSFAIGLFVYSLFFLPFFLLWSLVERRFSPPAYAEPERKHVVAFSTYYNKYRWIWILSDVLRLLIEWLNAGGGEENERRCSNDNVNVPLRAVQLVWNLVATLWSKCCGLESLQWMASCIYTYRQNGWWGCWCLSMKSVWTVQVHRHQ